jgi:hypothetical protein
MVFETVDIYHFMSTSHAACNCEARLRQAELLGQQEEQGAVGLSVHGTFGNVDAIFSIRLHLHGVPAGARRDVEVETSHCVFSGGGREELGHELADELDQDHRKNRRKVDSRHRR